MSNCQKCGFPIMDGTATYVGLTCKCHLRSIDQRFDVLPANRRDSAEIATLRAQLAASEARAERLQVALEWISRKLFVRSWTGTIGAPSSWRIAGDYRHTTQRMKGATLLEAVESAALAEVEAG